MTGAAMSTSQFENLGYQWRVSFTGEVSREGVQLVDAVRLKVRTEDGSVFCRDYPCSTSLSLTGLVAGTLGADMLKTKELLEVLSEEGMLPVAVNRHALGLTGECGEHFQLSSLKRPLTKACLLANQALAMLAEQDRQCVGLTVHRALRTTFDVQASPTRRDVAAVMRDSVLQSLADQGNSTSVQRTADESFAVLVLRTACEMMEPKDWLWAWLGDLVRDAQEPASAFSSGRSTAAVTA